jgi:iron uptake system EfeUOB component EfeO/EfeM
MADRAAYQQWLESAEKAKSIAANDSLELWERAHGVNQAYAGLALEGLRSKHRHKILAGFGKVNAVFAGYTLNSFDDYEKINESDLREIIKIVSSLAPPGSK